MLFMRNIRFKLTVLWIFIFIFLWGLFQLTFPLQKMKNQLDKIEFYIDKNDWKKAQDYTAQFTDTFAKNRFFVQINNATEAFTNFEYTIGQLEITIKHKEVSALEYIGGLKESLNLVIKPFSGP